MHTTGETETPAYYTQTEGRFEEHHTVMRILAHKYSNISGFCTKTVEQIKRSL